MARPVPKDGETTAPSPTTRRPASCTNGWVALSGFAGFILSLALVHGAGLSPIHRTFVALAGTVLPMVILELFVLRVHRRPSTGLQWSTVSTPATASTRALHRVLVKLVGLAGTLTVIGACYWLFPIYHEHFFAPYWAALRAVAPWFAVAAPLYFFYIDRRMAEPYDGYWHAGMAVLGRLERVDGALLWQYALGWTIKGYFLPIMFVYLTNAIGGILNTNFLARQGGFLAFYDFAWNFAFAVDLVFGVIGYCLMLRLIDSHIRWSEPTMLGWTVALACYPPFSSLTFDRYFVYEDQLGWVAWLADFPSLQVLWGSTIIALLTVYAGSTVAFGYRFSNLTHRGILTHGPYRWSKHPAYLSKNLAWWLVSVPFISTAGVDEAIRHCLLLIGLNIVFFLRARTEERNLSRDPIYVAYALWIEQHGPLRFISHALPFLRYTPPIQRQD